MTKTLFNQRYYVILFFTLNTPCRPGTGMIGNQNLFKFDFPMSISGNFYNTPKTYFQIWAKNQQQGLVDSYIKVYNILSDLKWP